MNKTKFSLGGRNVSIIFAKVAHVAAILRRGPSKYYHVIKWNTDEDTFEHGAWFKGRLYESTCDISYCGRYFLYHAFKGSNPDRGYPMSYTGLSRLPWMKAYAMWCHLGTMEGGGRFLDDQTIGIREPLELHPNHTDLRGFEVYDLGHLGRTAFSEYKAITKRMRLNQLLVEEAEWSHHDHRDRIVWIQGYKIYLRENDTDVLLIDLTNLTPEMRAAPY